MDKQKRKFLDEAFLSLTVMATLRRSKTYREDAKEPDRAKFRDALRNQLVELAQQYATDVDDDSHIKNIEHLADKLSKEFAQVLKGGRFRIGSAQKALNLYLKYLWCTEQIPTPPHCLFDNFIIGKLSGCNSINWTTLDDVKDYRCLVVAARAMAGTVPLGTVGASGIQQRLTSREAV
jgi:hypothetical protein